MENREIKFRLYDKLKNEILFEGFHVFGEVTLLNAIGCHAFETKGERDSLDRYNDFTVMQFTGIKDNSGSEIYEADVVDTGYGIGKVVFHAGCFMVEWLDDKEASMELLASRDFKRWQTRNELKVIGNIYQNPELLS